MKPIAFIDIEATGLNRETDRIIELSIVKQFSAGERETKTRRFNPGFPIPAESTAVHGITDEMVKDCPPFWTVAKSLHALLEGCDIGGFGCISYDIPLLYNEFLRAGVDWDFKAHNIIDAGNIFKIKEPRDLSSALQFYCSKQHDGAHGAEADAIATADVFNAQLVKYPELLELPAEELALLSNYGRRILDLSGKFTHNDAGEVILNFGPHRGQLASNHTDFIEWMISKDFPPDTRKICYEILTGANVNTEEDEFDFE